MQELWNSIHTYEGHYKVNFPVTLGHEFSGEIVEVGADVKILKLVTVSLLKRHSMFVMSVNTVNQKTIIYATIEKVLEHK
ncbi:sorbitol dehydrogenase [Staphylococcus aureus]|uniref:Sorbitol dehydrogenase n=1 Tax=Staphylococcus aureus TaxID=1280 RepID=A0A380DL32_STAAU|nr:sorbitol dehydrogenase [Staphylococcus aureus]